MELGDRASRRISATKRSMSEKAELAKAFSAIAAIAFKSSVPQWGQHGAVAGAAAAPVSPVHPDPVSCAVESLAAGSGKSGLVGAAASGNGMRRLRHCGVGMPIGNRSGRPGGGGGSRSGSRSAFGGGGGGSGGGLGAGCCCFPAAVTSEQCSHSSPARGCEANGRVHDEQRVGCTP